MLSTRTVLLLMLLLLNAVVHDAFVIRTGSGGGGVGVDGGRRLTMIMTSIQSSSSSAAARKPFFRLSSSSSSSHDNDGTTTTTTTTNSKSSSSSSGSNNADPSSSSFLDNLQADLQMRWRIYQESSGYNFKQRMANVLAGEYDAAIVRAQIEEYIQSAPVVMFTWERSPSCRQAVRALTEVAGIDDDDEQQPKVKIVRLDNPWSQGNPLRAKLGKMVGRSSVPAIFIGGEYVGGFDAGVSDEAPGIVDLAFAGKLQAKLEQAGALEKKKKTSDS